MSRKRRIDPALKVELVEKYLRDEIGLYEAARLAGMSGKTASPVRRWINIYQNEGPSGLLEQNNNRCYSAKTKL
jgi:transposase-like protein